MRNALHLLAVDRRRGAALAARFGGRWLLPMLACHARARGEPVAVHWAAKLGVTGALAGQWLGRLSSSRDTVDWLAVLDATGPDAARDPLSWVPLRQLASSRSVIDYQSWAVGAALRRGPLPAVPGPFGHVSWLDDVKGWIARVMGDARPPAVAPYRVSAYEVVLGADTSRGRVYFKGLVGERIVEAVATRALESMFPRTFARTLAREEKEEGALWWLAGECPGKCLANGGVAAHAAARVLAAVQQRVASEPRVLDALPRLRLRAAVDWAADLTGSSIVREAFERACRRVDRDLPASWIPLDLDPGNIVVSGGGEVRFIDLDDSFVGPAPLAAAILARRAGDRSICRSYREAWGRQRHCVDWADVELAAALVDAWLGWTRARRQTERGEISGVIELAAERHARRLSALVEKR